MILTAQSISLRRLINNAQVINICSSTSIRRIGLASVQTVLMALGPDYTHYHSARQFVSSSASFKIFALCNVCEMHIYYSFLLPPHPTPHPHPPTPPAQLQAISYVGGTSDPDAPHSHNNDDVLCGSRLAH